MTNIQETTHDGMPAPERKATDHTAVLLPGYRRETILKTGVIPAKDAVSSAGYDGMSMIGFGITNRSDIRMGRELPLFEVAYQGNLYRIQCRPLDGQDHVTRDDDLAYELVRTVAPGLKCGGFYMERPSGVPNTPRALATEMVFMTGVCLADLIDNAYSIFHYRLDHEGKYPDSMTPAGYTLRELFLLSESADSQPRSLYETPTGTNPERWTLFINELDKMNPKLASYVTSSMAIREFGEGGVAAMREALKVRAPRALSAAVPMSFTPFLTAFPVPAHKTKFERVVGTSAGFI